VRWFVIVCLAVSLVVLVLVLTLAAYTPRFDVPLLDLEVAADDELVARGAYLFRGPAHCIACHGDPTADSRSLASTPPAGGKVWHIGLFGTFYAANLTPCAETGLGRRSDAEIARVLKHGIAHDGAMSPMMRVAMGPLADDDIRAVIAYMRSLPPVKHDVPDSKPGLLIAAMGAFGMMTPRGDVPEVVSAPPVAATVERGRYLAHGPGACASCHTVLDPAAGFAPATALFSGGTTEPSSLDENVLLTAPNLTADAETGITGRWSEELWVARFNAGELLPGTPMPWNMFANMHEDDVRAVYRYLRSLPPVRNDVGASVKFAR
jgi:mono/diheme cytochrome c family protein